MQSNNRFPKVSVLMPCYNHEHYVKDAIESVMSQTYPNVELIVVNDGSLDSSWEMVSSMQQKYDFVAINRSNRGLIETLKELRTLATGEYICILASDDRYYPDKIDLMYKELQMHPTSGLVVARTDRINSNGKVLGPTYGEYLGKGDLFQSLLFGRVYISYLATLVRAEAYREVVFIDDYIEDLPAWLQISRDWPVVFLDKIVGSHRQVHGSMSSNLTKMIASTQFIIDHFTDNKRPYPIGWCLRWFDSYSKISLKKAVFFLFSGKCTNKILLNPMFYKILLAKLRDYFIGIVRTSTGIYNR